MMITRMLAVCVVLGLFEGNACYRQRQILMFARGMLALTSWAWPNRGPIVAQSRPNTGPIRGPLEKTPQTMKTLRNQIVNMISLDILLLDITIHSCFLNGPRPGLVMGLDWATIGPRLGHVGSPRHEVR